jgi:uncharacterized membrane protein YvbJ
VRAAETRNYRETKRFTKIRESIEVGRELHSKASQPRRACKNVLNTDSETVKIIIITIIIIIIVGVFFLFLCQTATPLSSPRKSKFKKHRFFRHDDKHAVGVSLFFTVFHCFTCISIHYV